MIENFEEETSDLTPQEIKLANVVLGGMKLKYNSKDNPIKQDLIVSNMRGAGWDITGPRLRKIFNYLRSNGESIIATSKGCWYSFNKLEIESQIRSLEDRRKSLDGPINGLKKMLQNNY